MKPTLLLAFVTSCCLMHAPAHAAPASANANATTSLPANTTAAASAASTASTASTASVPAPASASVYASDSAPGAAAGVASATTGAAAAAPLAGTPAPAASGAMSGYGAPASGSTAGAAPLSNSSAGSSLLQTIFALGFVLALLIGLAWFMKRYGPKVSGASAAMRVIGSLNLGGRERVVLIEVADQWIVIGASPGRINALATMPRQETEPAAGLLQQPGLATSNFSEWLKQTIEKRNGK